MSNGEMPPEKEEVNLEAQYRDLWRLDLINVIQTRYRELLAENNEPTLMSLTIHICISLVIAIGKKMVCYKHGGDAFRKEYSAVVGQNLYMVAKKSN